LENHVNEIGHTGAIDEVRLDEMATLAGVWEASVRATHDFLDEADIEEFWPIVRNELFGALDLRCVRDDSGSLIAFLGVSETSLEALFVHPDHRGTGIGRRLVRFAIDELSADHVDVNEQNEQAVGFYRRMRFEVAGRSALDPLGKPYPMLHMRLPAASGATA
jgi:putative acetyltransferase